MIFQNNSHQDWWPNEQMILFENPCVILVNIDIKYIYWKLGILAMVVRTMEIIVDLKPV